ncbi:MAG: A/G-specific adenine glycosylase [bacterium]|nr:A/G-specific adenine glycosylase [bacterium]
MWAHYKKHGRHDLPWRPLSLKLRRDKGDIIYKILVSEVMLQQTQVERVIPFYKSFIKQFPTALRLAEAPLSDVLAAWQGLGYNRRAKMLREAAQTMQDASFSSYRTDLMQLVKKLERLPGVGPYTARAVVAFAFNADVVFVETNIRTAVIHHFFSGMKDFVNPTSDVRFTKSHTSSGIISDRDIEDILTRVLPKDRAREWYSALMDYGAHLKRSGVKVNTKSTHYTKQTKFEGSLRQVRGAIVKALTAKKSLASVRKTYPDRFDAALAALEHNDLIKKNGRGWRIDDTAARP